MLEQTLDSTNNTNIATNHNMAGWSSANKMANDVSHAARNDKKTELEYSNAINQQNLSNHSALDELNHNRTFNRLMMMVGANQMLNIDPTEAVATDALFQGKANASWLSQLGQLAAGSIANKTAVATVPETGVANALATYNAVNSQNAQNNATNSALANALTAATVALAGISQKGMVNTPPVGAAPAQI